MIQHMSIFMLYQVASPFPLSFNKSIIKIDIKREEERMEIKQKLIPKNLTDTRPGIPMSPTYITIHETDNTDKGATASAHAILQANGNNRTASWHYSVDDKEIWQSIPDNEVAWACGDGANGTGNRHSISVEICVNSDGNFEKAKQNAIWLVQYLMDKHNISITNVVQHNKWSGKNCPRKLRASGWNEFLNQIKAGASNYRRILKITNPYMTGEDVRKVQQRLSITADGVYGPDTANAVIQFQMSHKLVSDGIVGEETWNALFPPATMYDLSYLKDEALVAIISSSYPNKITEKVEWAMGARADCVLLVKRGFDLRKLQEALNKLYPVE